MFNKILIILLLFTGLVYADNGWNEPKLLSTGDHNQTATIGMDKTGVLHAFWAKPDTIPGNHGCIMYSHSGDLGEHWSVPVNISNNPTDRPIEPKVVFDSQNNIHLVYQNIFNSKVYYQNNINNQWSAPLEIVDYASSYVNAVIDNNDKIYVFWLIHYSSSNVKSYFKHYIAGNWSESKLVNDSIIHLNMVYGHDNKIHMAGQSIGDLKKRRAYYFNYDLSEDQFSGFADISNNLKPSQNISIAKFSSSTGQVHCALNVGMYSDTASTYYIGDFDQVWQQPIRISEHSHPWSKQILLDSGSNPHLFDKNLEQDTVFRNYKVGDQWQREVVAKRQIDNGIKYNIGNDKAIIHDNNIYYIYAYGIYNQGSKIYFKKKKLTVDIEDNGQLTMDNLHLANYPNPFNNNTKISFNLPQISEIKLEVFNAKGELVQSIFKGQLKSGQHALNFNATALNSGVFYCRLTTATEIKTTKIMLLK